jgi:hypothetical protein
VTSTCRNPGLLTEWKQPTDIYDIAVASPVYFIPDDFHRPSPTKASVKISVTDEEKNPISAVVSVVDNGKEIIKQNTDAEGLATINTPASAILVINAIGFEEDRIDLFMDSQLFSFCRNFNDFFTPGGFNELKNILASMSFEVKLRRKANLR